MSSQTYLFKFTLKELTTGLLSLIVNCLKWTTWKLSDNVSNVFHIWISVANRYVKFQSCELYHFCVLLL